MKRGSIATSTKGSHGHTEVRTPRQAFSIGVLHGLAGTGAIVLLLIAALPSQVEAMAAMAVFAPMSIVSMAACTAAFAWVLTRPGDRAPLPQPSDSAPGRVRRPIRPLVRRADLSQPREPRCRDRNLAVGDAAVVGRQRNRHQRPEPCLVEALPRTFEQQPVLEHAAGEDDRVEPALATGALSSLRAPRRQAPR